MSITIIQPVPVALRFFALAVFALWANVAKPQLDTIHLFPPLPLASTRGALYLTTPDPNPVPFMITTPDGIPVDSGTVSSTINYSYDMPSVPVSHPLTLAAADHNQVVSGKGLMVRSARPILANLKMEYGCQAYSITSKGRRAQGRRFRMAHGRGGACSSIFKALCSIVATEDSTNVQINLNNITTQGSNATTGNVFLWMDRGETYTFTVGCIGSSPAQKDSLMGRLVIASKPIVTTMGSWEFSYNGGSGHDIGLDQPFPEDLYGRNFAVLQGNGSNTQERLELIASEDGTDIFLNGSVVPTATLNAGEFLEVSGTNFTTDGAMAISASRPIAVWQVLWGSTSHANPSLNFVPPLSCLILNDAGPIPSVDSIYNQQYTSGLNIVTLAGSNVSLNNGPALTNPIAIPGGIFEGYRLSGLGGDQSVSADSVAMVSTFGHRSCNAFSGFYAGLLNFPRIDPGQNSPFCPDTLFINNDFDSIQWLLNGQPVNGGTDSFLVINGAVGSYAVVVGINGCVDTSGTMNVNCVILPTEVMNLKVECDGAQKRISWLSSDEGNNVEFDVQGSLDGHKWRSLGKGEGVGEGKNEFPLDKGAQQYPFYRVSYWSGSEYGHSNSVRNPCPHNPLAIWVPSRTSQPRELHWNGFQQEVNLRIISLDGRTFFSQIADPKGVTTIDLPSGFYMAEAWNAEGRVNCKFVIP